MINGPGLPTIPPADPPQPEPAPAPAPGESAAGYVTCDFCGCQLTRKHGEIIRMGEAARRFRDREERETATNAELESLRSQLATVRTQLAEAERMLREDAERSGPAASSNRI